MAERIPSWTLTVLPTPDASLFGSFLPPPATAAMQPTISRAVPVSLQPLPVLTVTHMVPQASAWPGVPGVQGQGVQLPPGGLPPTVGQLPPWGLHPGMAPPTAPVHRCIHQLQPEQLMGQWPGAMLHGEPPQPAGSCPLQAPGLPSPPPVLLPAPSVQQQVPPMPCTLPASWEQAMGPFGDTMMLTEHQGHPEPTNVCPHPTTAPLACSTATLESGAVTTSTDIAEDTANIDDLLTWISELTSNADIPVNTAEIDDILKWISNEETPSSDIPDDNMEIDNLLTWIDEASSCLEVPQQMFPDVPSRLSTSPFIRALPDFPRGSRKPNREAQADAGPLSGPFSGQPASSESLSWGHLMEEARQRQPRVVLTHLAMPAALDAPVPPSPHNARLIEEVQQRQPRVVLTRLALPPGCVSCRVPDEHPGDGTEPAECPVSTCTTRNGKSRGQKQRTGSIRTRKRKLPLGQDVPGQKRRR